MPIPIVLDSCRECKHRYYNRSLEEYVCIKLVSSGSKKYILGRSNYGEVDEGFKSCFVSYTREDLIPNECPLRK